MLTLLLLRSLARSAVSRDRYYGVNDSATVWSGLGVDVTGLYLLSQFDRTVFLLVFMMYPAYRAGLIASLLPILWASYLVERLGGMAIVCGSNARRQHVDFSLLIMCLHEAWPVFGVVPRLGASHSGRRPTSLLDLRVRVRANHTLNEEVASATRGSCQVPRVRSLSMCQPIPGQFATREDVMVPT